MTTNLSYFTDVHMKVQKLRVATGGRITHLMKQGRTDERTQHIHDIAVELEETLERYIAEDFETHPTYPWTSRQKGCGHEAAAKVIGIIEGVTFKNALLSDLKDVRIVETMQELKDNWADLEKAHPNMFRWRSGIYAFDTPSKMRRFAGLAPVDGRSEKAKKGQTGLHYNPELRMMLWRLLTSLMRARGVWYEKYKENEAYYEIRCEREGIKVVPTPAGRFCSVCLVEKEVSKTTKICPDCGEKLMAKGEPPGVIFRGHLVNMAKRRTIRLWSDLLWVVWRQALNLSTRTPYIVEYGGHHLIDPWEVVDK